MCLVPHACGVISGVEATATQAKYINLDLHKFCARARGLCYTMCQKKKFILKGEKNENNDREAYRKEIAVNQ